MSASEKLRALVEPLQAFGLPCSELGPGLHDFVLLSDYDALALPLIADVVEAAENAVTCAWMDRATDEQNIELKRRADAVSSSVAALREHLEGTKLNSKEEEA